MNTEMSKEARQKLVRKFWGMGKVFYPEKKLEEYEDAAPYTVILKQKCRLEHDPVGWEVSLMRWFTRVSVEHFRDEAKAKARFEEMKEQAIIKVGCEALGIDYEPAL